MDNIERFNRYTAAIFAALYDGFPERTALTPQRLLDIDPGDLEDPVEVPAEVYFLDATLIWLRDAGYIWADNRIHHGTSAVLTPKGLEVLRAVPSTVNPDESIGEQIRRAVREKAIDTASALIPRALAHGYALIQQGLAQLGQP